ncbi:MAG: energy transducer TonB [Betaproteobacteria bacterium]|nr:energy transducer TonB [Betaproteobacteria bacterium]
MTIAARRPAAIAPAFAASLVIHGAVAVALFGLVATGRQGDGDVPAPLAVRLVGPPAAAEAPPAPATPDVVVSAEASPVALPAPSSEAGVAPQPARVAEEPRAVADPRPSPSATAPPPGTVSARENYAAMGGISPDLVSRAHMNYLIEVEKPVRVLNLPEVPYPPEALAAGRQDTVVAWVAIDREGAIEDVVIDSGEPEFADAVLAALPTAKFLPAEERGELVPFYILLQFDFRTARGTATAPAAVAAEPAN